MSSADKLLSVLTLFTAGGEPLTVEEVSRQLDLPQSTTYRYLRSLSDAGLIASIRAGSYVLGPTIVMLDRQMRRFDPLLVASRGVMEELAAGIEVSGVLLLCRLFRDQVMCVHSVEVAAPDLEVAYERGRLMPLFRGAASKAILASLAPRNARGLYGQQPQAFAAAGLGASWDEVKECFRALRRAGGVVTYSEIDSDVLGIACPIFDPAGQVLGSLGFVAGGRRPGDALVPALLEALRQGAEDIGQALRQAEEMETAPGA
ncbi:IclR family transcriptional regulator [Pseudoroseicyclus sp. CXY001]|uniref:IclR family transcriptional regulator n=1 Tax=Pseudoroseicyclus sp. CXY001 TaxID=3242492 RepID=UPI003571446B